MSNADEPAVSAVSEPGGRRVHAVLELLLDVVLFLFLHADLLERSAEDR
jgi:hypothetical protein